MTGTQTNAKNKPNTAAPITPMAAVRSPAAMRFPHEGSHVTQSDECRRG